MILNMKFVWILKGDWLQTNEYSEQEKNSLTSSLKKVKNSQSEKRSALRVVKKDYVVVLFWDKEVKMTLHHVLFCSVLRIVELQKVKGKKKWRVSQQGTIEIFIIYFIWKSTTPVLIPTIFLVSCNWTIRHQVSMKAKGHFL